ncbi:MAG TPA: universal stress protein [Telluria sp.]|nr:universal stress protein [Telluria sp.]
MPYKTILVHADLSPHAAARIRLAAAIALAEDAHLVGAAMTGISRFVYPNNASDLARTVIAGHVEALYEHASQALAQFESVARSCGVRSFEPRLVADDPEGGLVQLSRFCDLLVLSQTDPASNVTGAVRDLPEYVILNVARPVLLVPYSREYADIHGPALIAWDGSHEASRAVSSALPLLMRASPVVVTHFEPEEADQPDPQSLELLAWLGRFGIKATLLVRPGGIDHGNALLALATERKAGLVVMGGYGHTRFRELFLGGVTHTMLRRMTMPVLMSH